MMAEHRDEEMTRCDKFFTILGLATLSWLLVVFVIIGLFCIFGR